jgi:hypothetical protein
MIYYCCDPQRRNLIRGTAINGIDFLEVLDNDAVNESDRQRFLFVHFVNPLGANAPAVGNVIVQGGDRIDDVEVVGVVVGTGSQANVLTVEVDKAGDFSRYRLCIVRDAQDTSPPDGIDPVLASVDFWFKVECPTNFDCATQTVCPDDREPPQQIDYLARDYASYRRLILDRLSVLMPDWRDRNPADIGVLHAELLAYAADRLSYRQDAIGTEAYLRTARSRISIRRHARLLDYFIFDGANARTLVQLAVSQDLIPPGPDPAPAVGRKTKLLTRLGPEFEVGVADDDRIIDRADAVFETMDDVGSLHVEHNRIEFHTWGDMRCCLPMGSTRATLAGHLPTLSAGDLLVFEEVFGPATGREEDADRTHRHAVRVTEVRATDPTSGDPLTDPQSGQEITDITWHRDDALPFPLCISSLTNDDTIIEGVSVARGNIVLADHGRTITEVLDPVPAAKIAEIPRASVDPCNRPEGQPLAPRYRPVLGHRPLTFTARPPRGVGSPESRGAPVAAEWDRTYPDIRLTEIGGGPEAWEPRHDLLNSNPHEKHFVVEVESDQSAILRFGDGKHGDCPETGTRFEAEYRVGNGAAGNIGVDSLAHIVAGPPEINEVRNLTPARGGAEPETIEHVRQHAPFAFRRQERAVTLADYANVTERDARVQRANASFRWTGSWHSVFVTVDRAAGQDFDTGFEIEPPFEADIRSYLERFRMAGHDLKVDEPRFVALEIEMDVCVDSEHFRSDVERALLEVFTSGKRADGQRGLFHPDNFTFGQTVFLSPLYLAAQAIEGVDSVHIRKFRRADGRGDDALGAGQLTLERLEIAQLDSDPNFPERGTLRLNMMGGK